MDEYQHQHQCRAILTLSMEIVQGGESLNSQKLINKYNCKYEAWMYVRCTLAASECHLTVMDHSDHSLQSLLIILWVCLNQVAGGYSRVQGWD